MDLDSNHHIDLQRIQMDFETQSQVFHQQIELLTKSSNEKTTIIKQLEEENAYNLTQFQELKGEISALRKEKNERVEHLNQLIEEYEKKILALESEKNSLEFSLEKLNLEYQSEKQEEFMQKIKILETQIVKNENSKEKLQGEWVEAHRGIEEKLKVIEKIKEEFIEVTKGFFFSIDG